MKVEILRIGPESVPSIAPLTAAFRVALLSYKGIAALPDLAAARCELQEYLDAGWPVCLARLGGEAVGYMVLRIEEPNVWVESIFVRADHRRQGIASRLFAEAEAMAAQRGEETVFNYVHPNNHGMIAFLASRGYTVLNLIEIRKPYAGEEVKATIQVGEHRFDY